MHQVKDMVLLRTFVPSSSMKLAMFIVLFWWGSRGKHPRGRLTSSTEWCSPLPRGKGLRSWWHGSFVTVLIFWATVADGRKTGKVLVSRKPSPISVEELHSVDIEVLKSVKRQYFREELVCLQGKESEVEPKESVRVSSARSVKKSSSIAKLDPELRDGLLCVGGRLRQAPIEQEQRHPVLLP